MQLNQEKGMIQETKRHLAGKAQKAIKTIFLAILLCSVSFCTVFSIIKESRKESETENRALAQWNNPTMQSLINGTWGAETEKYLKDQVVFRDMILKGYYLFLDLQGMIERNGYVLGNNSTILQVMDEKDFQEAKEFGTDKVEMMTRIQAVADLYGGRVIYLNVPYHREIFDDSFPAGYMKQKEYYDTKRNSIISKAKEAGICVVETYDLFMAHQDEYIYYYTDNHWTQKGAYYAYKELLSTIERLEGNGLAFPDWDEMTVTVRSDRMVGSYIKVLGDSGRISSDHMEYAIPTDMPDYIRFDNDVKTDRRLINTGINSYNAYMEGNIGNTKVITDRPNLPSILYIGCSYTNTLEAMSVYNFSRMESIDIRYWNGNLKEYLLESKPDYIVIVRDDITQDNPRLE